jgi:hypothetical protein
MFQPPPNVEVMLHSIVQVQETIRAREANALTFFLGVVAINASVAAWMFRDQDRPERRPRWLFSWMIVVNAFVALGYAATGYEYYEWRSQLLDLAERLPGVFLPAGFFHIGMAVVYVLTALVFALGWAWGRKQAHHSPR